MNFYYFGFKKEERERERKKENTFGLKPSARKGRRGWCNLNVPGIWISCGYSNVEKMRMGKNVVCNK